MFSKRTIDAKVNIDIFGKPITKAAIEDKALKVALKIKAEVDQGLLHNVVLLPIMDDAFDYAGLVRQNLIDLNCPHQQASVIIKSFDDNRPPQITLSKSKAEIFGCDVIVIEGSLGTGQRAFLLSEFLLSLRVRKVRLACLTNNPDEFQFPLTIDYPTFHLGENPKSTTTLVLQTMFAHRQEETTLAPEFLVASL